MRKHFLHYLILVLILFTGFIVFFSYPDNLVKFKVGVLISLAYVFWGVIHHLLENDFNLKIVVEYALVGFLSIALLGGTLL